MIRPLGVPLPQESLTVPWPLSVGDLARVDAIVARAGDESRPFHTITDRDAGTYTVHLLPPLGTLGAPSALEQKGCPICGWVASFHEAVGLWDACGCEP